MIRIALVVALIASCAKKAEPTKELQVPALSAEETQRSRDACQAYVDHVCACTDKVPGLAEQCRLAHALPEAVRIGIEVAASPDSKREDVLGAQGSVRKTVKECIEETAKLPSLGCP